MPLPDFRFRLVFNPQSEIPNPIVAGFTDVPRVFAGAAGQGGGRGDRNGDARWGRLLRGQVFASASHRMLPQSIARMMRYLKKALAPAGNAGDAGQRHAQGVGMPSARTFGSIDAPGR